MKHLKAFGVTLNERPVDRTAIAGIGTAIEFARFGRIISAIKHIERANPKVSREEAKMIIHSLGYGRELRWPEQERRPVRCL